MNKQAGFTLIEIIAVLVILGILAAVAIPKYQDLQDEATRKAAAGVVAAGLSQMTMNYSKTLLATNGDTATAEANAADCSETQIPDEYTLTCATGTDGVVATHTATGINYAATWNAP